MYRDLLAHLDKSPLMALPMLAMFLFLLVFVTVTARALLQGKVDVARAAALPFDDHDTDRSAAGKDVGRGQA